MFKKKKKVDKEPFFVVVGGGCWVADLWSQTSLTKKKKSLRLAEKKKLVRKLWAYFYYDKQKYSHTCTDILK